MYTTVHEMLQADVDSVAHLLLDLEDIKFREALVCNTHDCGPTIALTLYYLARRNLRATYRQT
jgi:hypothetical protein